MAVEKPNKPDSVAVLPTTTRRPLILTTSNKVPLVPKPTTPFPVSNRNDGNIILTYI